MNSSAQKSGQLLYRDNGQRSAVLSKTRKIVLKVGTRLLTGDKTSSKSQRVFQLVEAVAGLRKKGYDVILVSSGAIGAGMTVLGSSKRPRQLPRLQSYAAVGQCRLMYLYETACEKFGFHSAQILLTSDDVQDRERHLNVTSCLNALLAKGVLPVINENDSVSVDEIKFGDNDTLAASVAVMVKADLTLLLTTVDGLHETANGEFGRRISVVNEITPEITGMAKGTADPNFSVGGMTSKIQAANAVNRAGETLWIADGSDFNITGDIVAGKDVGTLFLPVKNTPMRGHQRYLAFFADYNGSIVIDPGAVKALTKEGRSLLPKGIIDAAGQFQRGDTVRIMTADGIEIARGMCNYSKEEVLKIRGAHSREIDNILGYQAIDNTVIHRDRMVITENASDNTTTITPEN